MIIENLKTRAELKSIREQLKKEGKKVVFTNGCFDLIHAGHIDYLTKAKETGDVLIVALNSDKSIGRIKGGNRPVLTELERAFIVSSLKPVDFVTFFEEDTPAKIIEDLVPDILVKGEDWAADKIIGSDTVIKNGGEVKRIKFVNRQSTSNIIKIITDRFCKKE